LKSALSALGMPVAFTDSADFSGMTDAQLEIGDVCIKPSSPSMRPAQKRSSQRRDYGNRVFTTSVTIDQPFIFLIRDIQTGAILLSGAY